MKAKMKTGYLLTILKKIKNKLNDHCNNTTKIKDFKMCSETKRTVVCVLLLLSLEAI